MFAAAGLVSVRDHFAQVNVVLILVLFVLLGAVVGGRVAGAVSAVVASISYDFFHTLPYNSLKIDRAADIETTILLLAVGLIIGEIVVRADRIRNAIGGTRRELSGLHRVARLAADGETADDVISAVCAELTETLGLTRCFYETSPFAGTYARLEQTGSITGTNVVQYTKHGFELPHGGVELPVLVNDQIVGRFVLVPTPGHGVTVDRRMVAVALADQVSVVLGRRTAA
jgi:K+-sensing histidine kinase KdpD